MSKIRVHLADSDHFSRAGISGVLAMADDIVIEKITDSMAGAVTASSEHRPDIVLLEASLNGNDIYRAIQSIVTESPNTRVAVLATKYDRTEALLTYSAGSSALISKSSISEELPSTLRLIATGYKIFAAPHDGWEIVSLSPHRTQNQSIIEALNDRDRRLISSVAAGLTNTQISRTLHISEGSVKLHLARLMDELNVSNRVQLAVIATENGLITSADLKTA